MERSQRAFAAHCSNSIHGKAKMLSCCAKARHWASTGKRRWEKPQPQINADGHPGCSNFVMEKPWAVRLKPRVAPISIGDPSPMAQDDTLYIRVKISQVCQQSHTDSLRK